MKRDRSAGGPPDRSSFATSVDPTEARKLTIPMTRVIRGLTSGAAMSGTSPNRAAESGMLWRMAVLAEAVAF